MNEVLNKRYDALVVGSGPAGSTAVKELTERGMDVLLLEAGRDITEDDFVPGPPTPPAAMSIDLFGRARAFLRGQYVQARRAMYQPQKDPFLVNDLQQPYTTKDGNFLWIRGQQLGGRFHSYGRMLLRASDHEFKGKTLTGRGEDWPISYSDLEPYYDRIEEFLGLYGEKDGIPNLPDGRYRGPSLLTESEKQFKKVVEERWPERKVIPWRYAAPNLHRVPLGVVAARETGRLTERMNAVVSRVTIDRSTGKADGVVFIDRITKKEYTVKADVIVLCASTIESIRLMLNSATDGHPDGLGNSSGLLGKYFMDQTPSLLFGDDPSRPGFERIDPAPPDPYYPPVGGIYIPQFDNVDGITNPNFEHGWAMQGTVGRIPVPEGHGGTVGLMGFGEIPAYRENNVSISRAIKDRWGIPVPRIRLGITDNERELMRAQVAGLKEMALASGYRINFAGSPLGLDSKKVWPNADPFSRALFVLAFKKSVSMGAAIHECGGARIGSDPKTSVLNEFNQSWDVPNLFVTDASAYVTNGAVGPTLTIMAMTARACEYIADQHAAGAL
ncbi:GMC oxidoreductase [Leifsonia shinshuensis]|uniref:Choline dehydrogenase-like flavoprotein n=1 Tax=Leifsonia shinshuensis TaxID=150026 RepID=A0A853D0H6_9MICO|nr:GMC family oxidoreductase [Leifsonia shinshuensis]NYJ25613.1 choline dehydrogenase-like flavoprotein [Leifsonia shinshuensis]